MAGSGDFLPSSFISLSYRIWSSRHRIYLMPDNTFNSDPGVIIAHYFQFLRSILNHWFSDFLAQSAHKSSPLVSFLRQQLIILITKEIRSKWANIKHVEKHNYRPFRSATSPPFLRATEGKLFWKCLWQSLLMFIYGNKWEGNDFNYIIIRKIEKREVGTRVPRVCNNINKVGCAHKG